MNPSVLSRIGAEAGLLFHAIDAPQRRALFVEVGEARVRGATFLDERIAADSRGGFWLPLAELDALPCMPGSAPQGFLFHIGHCGSTLLSRLLDQWPATLGLREPRVLRDVAALRDAAVETAWLSVEQWRALFQRTVALLGRRFRPDEQVVVKATSSCNNLVEPLLAAAPDVRIVLLHMPLESYLATLLKAPSRLDVLTFAPMRLGYLQQECNADDLRLDRLDEVEIIALGWIAEMARFARLSRCADAPRILRCDFEEFLRDPAARLATIATHLGLAGAEANARSAVQSEILREYSKSPGHAYAHADREHDLGLARRRFGTEIARGVRFAESLVERYPGLGHGLVWERQ
jgi:hypothetical protein